MARAQSFTVADPATLSTNLVFSSPHSGRDYPSELVERSRLGLLQLRASEDALVDDLFSAAPSFGAPLIAATAPRAWLDLNRGPDELDPALIEGVRSKGLNQRVAAGLGVVPRVVSEGAAIYHGKISLTEARSRIRDVHTPYHTALESLLMDARDRFGAAILFDCHSMPTEALRAAPRVLGRSPQIVLGDRFGAAAGRSFIAETKLAFERAGFVVARNAPFAGGYITQRYGRPSYGIHAIQVEIDRGLYLDQDRIEPNGNYAEIKRLITQVVGDLTRLSSGIGGLAAE